MYESGQKIRIARRAIYASSTSREQEFDREVVECREIEGQAAALITIKSASGRITKGRLSNGHINVYHPKPARYEIIG